MRRGSRSHRAFTLIELLVVLAVLAILLAILLPALGAGRSAAIDLRCRAQLRTVTQSFLTFANDSSGVSRGDSDKLNDKVFRLEDFQESIYGLDEFWTGSRSAKSVLPDSAMVLVCPAAGGTLERRYGFPCSAGAVTPQRSVSIGFNKRLDTGTRFVDSTPRGTRAYLTEKILQFPDVPLLFDVDGAAATAKGVLPYYSAPPVPNKDGTPDIYTTGRFWFPSFRHRGSMSVGFVGGQVLSSKSPTKEPWWRWDYQPG